MTLAVTDDAEGLVAALERRVDQLKADIAEHVDALGHIERVCKGSRQRTRRIRWIEQRALSALNSNDDWKTVDMPRNDPALEKLTTMVCEIFPYVKRELRALQDIYTTEDDSGHEVIFDEEIKRDVETIERFIRDAKHNIQAIREAEERGT